VVGAPFHTSGGVTARGATFTYHGSGTGVAAAPAHTALGGQAGANFGRAVSTAGDADADGYSDIVVGAPFAVHLGTTSGTVSLFRGSAGGLQAFAETVVGGDQEREEVGAAVANAGDVDGDGYADVVIGHPGYQNGGDDVGRYQLVRGGPGGFQLPALIMIGGFNEGDRLGAAVATLGDLNADGYADFAVGSPSDSASSPDARVWVHFGGPSEWTNYADRIELRSSAPQSQFFGFSIATAGDVDGDGFSEFLVGDPNDSFVEGAMEGTAALFELARSVPVSQPTGPNDGQPDTRRGTSLAISPAMEPSGFPRLIVGEPGYNIGGPNFGIVYGFRGSLEGVGGPGFFSFFGETAEERFGREVTDVGDVNRDGWSDVVIASPTYTGSGGTEAGRVWLLRGKPSTPLDPPAVVLEGNQALARVGSAISGRGDVNGDGYHDFVIGARDWDEPGLADCGKVWLVYGAPGGTGPGFWTATGTTPGQGLGASVALADLDADGFGDVIVGSVSPLSVSPPSGRVEIHYGSAGGPSATPAWGITSNVPSPTFGTGLAAGDVTGDDEADLVVGAPGETGAGRIFLFRGQPGRGRPFYAWSRPGTQFGAQFGARIAAGGDVDGDGIGDFAVAEPKYDAGLTDAGRVHMYYGSPAEPDAVWSYASNIASLELGTGLARLNDVNNDGFADLAAGGPNPLPGGTGRYYVFLGNGRPGVGRSVMLLKDFSPNPFVFRPARIGANDPLYLSWGVRSAEGRARVRTEVETVVHGEPFTGTAIDASGTLDTGPVQPEVGSVLSLITTVTLPWQGTAYSTRARSRSASPFFPGSRWIRPESQATGDFDVLRGGSEVAVPGDPRLGPGNAPRLGLIAPNPMRSAGVVAGSSRIAYELPRPAHVVLEIHDVRGARVRRLVDESRPGGASIATWDGRDAEGRMAPAGLYLVRLVAEGHTERGRIVRLP
jgi:hypothetical protein